MYYIKYIFFLVLWNTGVAQKEADWRHFGKNVAMSFSSGAYACMAAINANESFSSVSDVLGNLYEF